MERYGPEAFGERMADVYDTWYGTRIALPLAARGLSVRGIDASAAMVAKLREKPGGDAIPVSIGDFADVAVDGAFDLIFVAFNTLFNLTSQDDQVRCFQNVARRLTARGVFVVEAFVPDVAGLQRQNVRAVHATIDSATLEASVHDPVSQIVQYQYVVITKDGARLYPVPMRYAWPSELDLMARLAGLELRERWGGWDRSPFTASSSAHVSVYARAEPSSGSANEREREVTGMADRSRQLRVALVVFGVAFLLVHPLMIVWPSGWAWQPSQHEYEQMIVGIYATLGVFLLWASREPDAHLSLIWFTVWSSAVHGGIMAVQAIVDPAERGHLPGDVAALFLVAAVLGVLTPRGVTRRARQGAA